MNKNRFRVVNPPVEVKPTIQFPRSRIVQFYKENPDWHTAKGLRFGQAFYNFMQLEKVTNAADKAFCDKLFNADSLTAQRMVIERTDWNA